MKIRLLNLRDILRTNFWLIPAAMALSTAALAFVSIRLDYGDIAVPARWLWSGGAEGAREVLSVIAASMVTVAGVVFSITIVVLALTSSQYGPRAIRTFMRDPGDQVVLGTFVSTYLYCILILRMTSTSGAHPFVPHLSVSIAVLFAGASICVLIYFIHHVASSIHVEYVTSYVAGSLLSGIDRMFPDYSGQEEARVNPALPAEDEATPLLSFRNGYIQGIENDELVKLAQKNDMVISLQQHAGNFIHERMPLALVWSSTPLSHDLGKKLDGCFVLGTGRTPTQDVDFAIHQLVEIAVRALSPSLNDPFTAVTCLDWLGAALTKLARKSFPSPYRYDAAGALRLVVQQDSFAHVMDSAFVPIRYYGKKSPMVLLRLMKTLASVAGQVLRPQDESSVLEHAQATLKAARDLPPDYQVAEIKEIFAAMAAGRRFPGAAPGLSPPGGGRGKG